MSTDPRADMLRGLPGDDKYEEAASAYSALGEPMKAMICREVADSCPSVFRKWCKATGVLRRFRAEYARERKGVAAQLLDRALGAECNSNLVRHVLCGFFTQGKTGRALNDFFLSMAAPWYESPERVAKAELALNQLSDQYNKRFPGLASLYTACLRAFYPEWFDGSLPPRKSCRDEKNVSFGGVYPCVAHDVDADSAEAEEVVQCHCSTGFLTQTDKILGDFDAAMKKLMAITRDVPARPIGESEDLPEQFSKAHGVAVECARVVLKKHDEVRAWAPPNDPVCNEIGCELCGHGGLEELTNSPSLSAIEEGAVQLRTLVTKARAGMSELKIQFDETVHSIEKLADDSEDESGVDRALPSENALQMAHALIEMRKLGEFIKEERAEQIEELRRRATSELADFRSRNRLTENEEEEIVRLNSEFADAKSLKGLRSIVGKADAFKEEAEGRLTATDYVATAEKILGAPTDPVSHLRLVECCLKAKQPELAYCLLDMVQEKWPYDDMFLADGAPTPESVLTIVADACVLVAGAAGVPWPILLANQSWIAALSRTDIESRNTRGALTVAWAVALSFWPDDAELESRFRQHCDLDALPDTESPVMATLAREFRDGGRAVIGDLHEDNALREVRQQVDEWLKKDHGHFVHVVTRGVDYLARVEHGEILPDLATRWARITKNCGRGAFTAARISASFDPESLYREALKRSSVGPKRDHEHRTPKLLERMTKIREHFDSFIESSERQSARGETLVSRQELMREAEAFVERDHPLSVIRQPLLDLLASGGAGDAKGYEREAVLLTLGQQRAELVRWLHPLLAHIETKPLADTCIAEAVLADVCEAIANPHGDEHLTALLRMKECMREVAILQGTQEAQDEFERFRRDLAEHLDELRCQAGEDALLRESDDALRRGRYPRAAILVRQVTDQFHEQRRCQGREHEKLLEALIKQVGDITTRAAMCNAGDEWIEKFQSTCARLQRTAADLLQKARAANVAPDHLERLQKAGDVLLYMVESMSRDFTEIDQLLGITEKSVSPVEREELMVCWERLRLDEENRGYREEVLNLWRSFAEGSPSQRGMNAEWGRFTIAFGRTTGLLYGQVAAESEKEGVRPVQIEGLTVDGRQTLFRHRRARFFEQPVFLYLLPGARPKDAELRTLRDHLHECPDESLHLVAVPGDAEHAWTILREIMHLHLKHVLLLDDEGLDLLLRNAEPGRVLRQMFLSTDPLTSVSPFVSSGRVLGDRNIYVGRKGPLLHLLNRDFSWICGGRRIGKSSLLHRLADQLRNQRSVSWRVVLVNAQHIVSGQDADNLLCRDIATELGLAISPATVDEFRLQLGSLVRREHVALLIDEVDSYIIRSREMHGDAFPLAKALRSVAQTDAPGGHLKVVMAGFKALYCEVTRKVQQIDFPFHQFLHETPGLGSLLDGETREVLELGFWHTLGIGFDAGVPRLVHERTGGHPAFVQEFCNCLLRHLETRRQGDSMMLTEDDVDSVFGDSTSKGGHSPFIEFIHDTLSMNFSIIERAIFMLMVHSVDNAAFAGSQDFTAEWVQREIRGLIRGSEGLPDEIQHALRMLVMTGMLSLSGKDYRIAIPSYVGILRRLDECGKDVIEDLLTAYQKSEARQ